MRDVIRHERSYWRRVGVEVVVSFVLTVLLGALLYLFKFLGSKPGFESLWAKLRLDISPQTGLVALGLLATLIIGLQVSVRGMPDAGDPTRTLGRQLALENTARVAGFSSFAIFLAVMGNYTIEGIAVNPARLLGVLAASVLLAGLAADAASASRERFGNDVEKARKHDAYVRLRATLYARRVAVPRIVPNRDVAGQVGFIILAGSIVPGVLYAMLGPTDHVFIDTAQASGFVALVGVISATTLSVASAAVAFRSLLLAAYLWAMCVAMLITATLVTFVAVHQVSTTHDWFAQLVAPILVLFIWLWQALLLSGRVPLPRGQLAGGLGYHAVSWALGRRVAKRSFTAKVDETALRARVSPRSVTTLVAAFVLPPVAALASHLQLRAPASPATRRVLRSSLVISYILLALLAAATGAILLH
jgi:hypothetical protein